MPNNFPGLLNSRSQASQSSKEMYPGQRGTDDQQDAARHMLAAGYLSRSYSPTVASGLGELNEAPSLTELLSRLFGKYNPNYGYEMDSHNNRLGIELAKRADSLEDFERLVNQAAEGAHGIPLEGKAYVLPSERDRLRYMDKYADGGAVKSKLEQMLDWLESPERTQQMQGVGRQVRGALQGIADAGETNRQATLSTMRSLDKGQGLFPDTPANRKMEQMAIDAALNVIGPGVIKPKGGNWLEGSVENALKGLKKNSMKPSIDDLRQTLAQRLTDMGVNPERISVLTDEQVVRQAAALPAYKHIPAQNITRSSEDTALNNWIDKQLTRYVQKEMATPEDPIRALAERGPIHFDPSGELNHTFMGVVQRKRNAFGLPDPLGQSPLARRWELQSDMVSNDIPAGERLEKGVYSNSSLTKNPWLKKVPPETAVYGIGIKTLPEDLGFTHLIDELRNATNPVSGLPRELLLKYESLPQVSVPQAVERVAKINEWRAAQMAAAKKAAREGIPVHKEYPEGYKWMAAPDTAVDERALKYIQDVGCEGGWCTQGSDLAKRYGGGGSKLYVLHGPKGEAVTQIMVKPGSDDPLAEVFRQLPREEQLALRERALGAEAASMDKFVIGREADANRALVRAQMLKERPELTELTAPERIVEIKGKQNRAPNPEYLPFVQDFVKSGKWSDVGDLQNTGLRRTRDAWNDLERQKIIDAGHEVPEYLSQDEIKALGERVWPGQWGDVGYASGGLVPSPVQGYNPDLIAARAAELRAELFPQ